MRHLDDIVRAAADLMKIDAEQAERRKAFLRIDDRDRELLRDLHERLGRERLDFVDEFYEHLLAFDETRRLIQDPATLERLKHA